MFREEGSGRQKKDCIGSLEIGDIPNKKIRPEY